MFNLSEKPQAANLIDPSATAMPARDRGKHAQNTRATGARPMTDAHTACFQTLAGRRPNA
jgi:hypothetical protein